MRISDWSSYVCSSDLMTGIVTYTANAQVDPDQSLNKQQQAVVSISALTAKGDLSKLKGELNKGLDAGLTVNQIKEAIMHLYAYAGFPRSLRGLQTFMTVLDERRAKDIQDEIGIDASLISDERSKYERDRKSTRLNSSH